MILHDNWEGTADEIIDRVNTKKEFFNTKTLGMCINEVSKSNSLGLAGFYNNDSDDFKMLRLSMATETEDREDFFKVNKKIYEELLDSRNDLVHHFQEKFNLNSISDCDKAQRYLDEQHKMLLPEIENLKRIARGRAELLKEILDLMTE